VARFEGVNIQAAQETMGQAEAIIRPLVSALPGYAGVLELASEDGKFLSITFFDSAENAAASEQVFDEELPRQLGEVFAAWGGTRADVTTYMVVGDERA
jgi:hypothetical protein